MKSSESELPPALQSRIDGVPIPDQRILDFVVDQELLSLKGLALHVLTTGVVADVLVTAIEAANATKPYEERLSVNREVVLDTLIAYHATRPTAEIAKKGQSSSPALNLYMKTHDDLDLSYLLSIEAGLPLGVVSAICDINRDRGFPERTIGPNNRYHLGQIDWNATITQLASWSVAGGIISLEQGFDDRIARHVGSTTSPKQLSQEELLRYQAWGIDRLKEFCSHINIEPENFLDWLKRQLQPKLSEEDATQISQTLIKELFNRDPKPREFLPTMPAYIFLARQIMAINSENPDDKHSKRLKRMLENPVKFLKRCASWGMIKQQADTFTSS